MEHFTFVLTEVAERECNAFYFFCRESSLFFKLYLSRHLLIYQYQVLMLVVVFAQTVSSLDILRFLKDVTIEFSAVGALKRCHRSYLLSVCLGKHNCS